MRIYGEREVRVGGPSQAPTCGGSRPSAEYLNRSEGYLLDCKSTEPGYIVTKCTHTKVV